MAFNDGSLDVWLNGQPVITDDDATLDVWLNGQPYVMYEAAAGGAVVDDALFFGTNF